MALELGFAKALPPSEREQRILALTGGGMRGLFSAAVLQKIEDLKKRSCRDMFTIFAGTSIGGILAIGLAAGVEASRLREAIRDHGPAVFRPRKSTRGWNVFNLFTSPYAQVPLQDAIKDILGEKADMTLEEIETPLIVTAVEHNRAIAKLFVSKPLAGPEDNLSIKLVDAALATSAAPTYFPPHRIDDRVYLDGGLIANAPDLVAAQKCVDVLSTRLQDLFILSIGTAAKDSRGDVDVKAPGRFGWLLRHRLFDITIDSQADLAVSQVQTFLEDRFYRIDRSPDRRIDLDDTGKRNLDELERLAGEAVSDFQADHAAWARFLPDRPS